jgi:ribosome assembly protein RRB1
LLISPLSSRPPPPPQTQQQQQRRQQKQQPQGPNPLQTHKHADEGFALDWSPAHEGRLATGDCARHIHVWDPASGAAGWAVSSPYVGHTASVEDLQWSPAEPTVFASASADGSVRVWDCRAAPKKGSMLCRPGAHASDVNVLSWNRLVGYMLASGGDDGALRVWDLRTFASSGGGALDAPPAAAAAAPNTNATTAAEPVAHFAFHRAPVTSVEWSPYEGSMLATAGADDQVAVWDLALERDPEEEAAAAAAAGAGAAAPPPDLPAQLMFVHAGQKDVKELRWHPQIPGMLVTTAADGFNAFRPSNL